MIAGEDSIELLMNGQWTSYERGAGLLTDSVRRFGRFERYRLVELSSPSAFKRALKLS